MNKDASAADSVKGNVETRGTIVSYRVNIQDGGKTQGVHIVPWYYTKIVTECHKREDSNAIYDCMSRRQKVHAGQRAAYLQQAQPGSSVRSL